MQLRRPNAGGRPGERGQAQQPRLSWTLLSTGEDGASVTVPDAHGLVARSPSSQTRGQNAAAGGRRMRSVSAQGHPARRLPLNLVSSEARNTTNCWSFT